MEKIALVTGGSSGIGKAAVQRFAQAGCQVIFACRNMERAQNQCAQLNDQNLSVEAVQCDVSQVTQIENMMEYIRKKYGRLDILINNAGVSNTLSIEDIDEAEWDRMLNINLKGAFFCAKLAYSMMKEQKYGRMVHLASIAGERGGQYSGVHYSVSKGGIITMSKCFALSGAAYGITSNVLSPGVVETEMSKKEGILADGIPLGRMAQPEEAADALYFLCSEQANYITGVTLDINGGQYMPS